MKVEVKCPCCNKLIYVNIDVQDKHEIDMIERIDREMEEQRKALFDSMTDEQKAEYERLKAKIEKDLFGDD